jgi:hypothetical protein
LSLTAKIISTLFLLVFGLGLTACGGAGYTGTGQPAQSKETPPTEAELAAQQKAREKQRADEDQRYGDSDYMAFVKKFPDGTIAHCVARYTSVSCAFK